jgi:phenylacetate-CoA ligase
MIGFFFHKKTYELIQRLQGKRVFQVLDQLEHSQWYNEKKIRELQWRKIKNIIEHAFNNISYYQKTFKTAGITPDQIKDYDDLRLLPVLTKDDLRNETYSLIAKTKSCIHTKYSTSGSTGTPSIVITDRGSEAYRHAAVFRNYRWVGLDLGDRIAKLWGTQLDVERKIKDQIKDFMLNRMTLSTNVLDQKSMFRYYEKLKVFKPKGLYGFTSAIYEFAQFLQNKSLPMGEFDMKGIIVTGEKILPYQREFIENTFKCRVYNNFACEEFATIAFECPERSLHLMSENVYVEVEKPEDEEGRGNLIITDLNNFIMPLIRYRMGDVGVISNQECSCGRGLPVLKEISGRSVDFVILPNGRIIHGINFDYLPKYFLNEIKQFQIVQEDINTIYVNLVKDKGFNESVIQNFEKKLRSLLGHEVNIIIVYKDSIPRERRGKFRFVISKLN